MSLFIAVIITVLFVICVLLVLTVCLIGYTAAGSPDVNGDPERDAGRPWPPDDDLQPMSQAWDHGSAKTAFHPQPQNRQP